MRAAFLYAALGETLPLLAVDVTETAWERFRSLFGLAAPPSGRGLVIGSCSFVCGCGLSQPVDVVFLDMNWVVIHVHARLSPWRAAARRDAARVLEVDGGGAERLGLRPGLKLYCLEPPVELSVETHGDVGDPHPGVRVHGTDPPLG